MPSGSLFFVEYLTKFTISTRTWYAYYGKSAYFMPTEWAVDRFADDGRVRREGIDLVDYEANNALFLSRYALSGR